MISATKAINQLFSKLSPRQKEVIFGRFGLAKSRDPETLAALGERFGITRERIRQIEAAALNLINREIVASPVFSSIVNKNRMYLKNAGGVARKEAILKFCSSFAEGLEERHLNLISDASRAFRFYEGDDNFWPFYYLGSGELADANSFIDSWTTFLRRQKNQVLFKSGAYKKQLKDFIKNRRLSESCADNYLSISKKFHKNSFGDFGLRDWPEINPLTIRDRIYLVLKKGGQPLHFETIARNINKASFDDKLALVPTVHNELIKDPRFVLVGRGLYGLSENGYEPGTAKEVIHRILKKHGPSDFSEVMSRVKKERFLKTNTVLANLQDKKFFERLPDGLYRVREA